MQICLVSNDERLCKLSDEVAGRAVIAIAPGETCPDADLYLWDLDDGFQLPEAPLLARGRHLFLVERCHLHRLELQLGNASGCILLKPVQRATLEAFLAGPADQGMATPAANSTGSTEELLSDRDSLLQYVLQTNVKLQEYDQDRAHFIARAVHDLRAPLTALHGYCGLLLDGELGPINMRQGELLQRMRASAARMAALARNVLALSAEGHMQRSLQVEHGDLDACLDQALHDLSQFLSEKQVSVEAHLESPEHPILFDRQQIVQVLMNLVENACKFTPKGGGIYIRGYSVLWDPGLSAGSGSPPGSNAYRIDIQDSGTGIDPALCERIFEPYVSYSGGSDRSGGGLGLAICKLIVTAHGGKIWVDPSQGGALFSFVLPLEPPAAAARRAPASEMDGVPGQMQEMNGRPA